MLLTVRVESESIVSQRRSITLSSVANISFRKPRFLISFQICSILLNSVMAVRRNLAAVNYPADCTFEEGVHGVIEQAERNKRIFIFAFYCLCGLLKAGKHRALTAGEVLAGISVFADLRKDILHKAELIRHKWIGFDKIILAGI